jgi:hypothetical protein
MEALRLLEIDARPMRSADTFAKYAGAFVNVFCVELTESAALGIASAELAAAGWEIHAVESSKLVTSSDFDAEPYGRRYFAQALIDGVVLVIHTYTSPPDGMSTH